MKTHALKSWPGIFEAMRTGKKTFDIRLNDRDYQIGDTLKLREYDPDKKEYTGRGMDFNVKHITEGLHGQLGVNVIVMQLEPAMVLGFNIHRRKEQTIEKLAKMLNDHKIKVCNATIRLHEEMVSLKITRVLEKAK